MSAPLCDLSVSIMEMVEAHLGEGIPMRHATFDDSGGKQEGVFIFAGYVAPKGYWDRFNGAWDDALAHYHLLHLHTSEFLKTISILGGGLKTDDDVYTILKPFTDAIKEHIVWGEGYAVIGATLADAWSPLSTQERKVIRQPDQDCFESAIGLACYSLISTLSAANPLAIQVDEGKHIARMANAYLHLKQVPLYRESLGAICFADDKKLRSVQAADLLAHLALRQWRKSKLSDPFDPRFTELIIRDAGRIKNHILIHDTEGLKMLAATRLQRPDAPIIV
jgi:hypothetical protein